MLWLDNYSKTMANQHPGKDGVFKLCLWSGMALFSYAGNQDLDGSVQKDGDGEVIPAMPTDILLRQREVMAGLEYIHKQGARYLPDSLVQRYSVCNVPPKIDISTHRELKQDKVKRMHTMDIVYPYKLVEENVGSNRGLLIILKQEFYDKNNMGSGECTDYVNLNLDENIFWRTLMVTHNAYLLVCTHSYKVDIAVLMYDLSCVMIGSVRQDKRWEVLANVYRCVPGLVAQLQMGYKNYLPCVRP